MNECQACGKELPEDAEQCVCDECWRKWCEQDAEIARLNPRVNE